MQQPIWKLQKNYGYTYEQINDVILPMADKGIEPTAAMGADMPLAVLSDRPQLLYDYFHQLFAQVTNPPIDAIREEIVTSTRVYIGGEGNLIKPSPKSSRQIKLTQPTADQRGTGQDQGAGHRGLQTLHALHPLSMWRRTARASNRRCSASIGSSTSTFQAGSSIFILSDRGVNEKMAAIPALLAVSGVQAYTIRRGIRTQLSILLESGEPTEVHHFALLIGYGARRSTRTWRWKRSPIASETGLLKEESVGTRRTSTSKPTSRAS